MNVVQPSLLSILDIPLMGKAGEACRRLGVRNLVASEVDVETMKVTYLNFNTNKTKRFRELYGPDAVIDEFYTDSKFDQPMIDMARHAFMVKGNTITQVK